MWYLYMDRGKRKCSLKKEHTYNCIHKVNGGSLPKTKLLEYKQVIMQGVGHDYVHYKALTKIILIDTVVLSVESSKSHNNNCNMITGGHCYYQVINMCWCRVSIPNCQ